LGEGDKFLDFLVWTCRSIFRLGELFFGLACDWFIEIALSTARSLFSPSKSAFNSRDNVPWIPNRINTDQPISFGKILLFDRGDCDEKKEYT